MCTLYAVYVIWLCSFDDVHTHTRMHARTHAHTHTHTHTQTLLSLSKLSMLASDSTDTETLQALNRELQMIEFQQNIPTEALEVGSASKLPELKLAEHVGIPSLVIPSGLGIHCSLL